MEEGVCKKAGWREGGETGGRNAWRKEICNHTHLSPHFHLLSHIQPCFLSTSAIPKPNSSPFPAIFLYPWLPFLLYRPISNFLPFSLSLPVFQVYESNLKVNRRDLSIVLISKARLFIVRRDVIFSIKIKSEIMSIDIWSLQLHTSTSTFNINRKTYFVLGRLEQPRQDRKYLVSILRAQQTN